jgi:oxygen-dependent protoporphyrinogen oxidase
MLTRIYRWPDGTAQHEVNHDQWLRAIDARLAQTSGLFLTGSSYRGTGIPDCVADGRSIGAKAHEWLGA